MAQERFTKEVYSRTVLLQEMLAERMCGRCHTIQLIHMCCEIARLTWRTKVTRRTAPRVCRGKWNQVRTLTVRSYVSVVIVNKVSSQQQLAQDWSTAEQHLVARSCWLHQKPRLGLRFLVCADVDRHIILVKMTGPLLEAGSQIHLTL